MPVPDSALIAAIRAGDAAALREIIRRHDRLVRFTIWRASKDRCRLDPQWLDSVASDAWAGFVGSLRRDPDRLIASPRAFLLRVARNTVVSSLRCLSGSDRESVLNNEEALENILSDENSPAHLAAEFEELEALRECVEGLDLPDKSLLAEAANILDRRWVAAAHALEIPESTLRSRWENVQKRLRLCVEGKLGHPFAPRD